jgi:signal transduction histidine kinase
MRIPGIVFGETGRFKYPAGMAESVRTERVLRESDARHAYLLELGDALRPLADPLEIQATASRILGEHLGVNRVAYFQLRGAEYVIERDYTNGVLPMVGRFPVAAFGQKILQENRSGRVAIGVDVASDATLSAAERAAFAAAQVGAYIAVPLFKNGEFVVGLGVHARGPRNWTAQEISRVEETAERTWAAVVHARAEEALARSEEKYRTLFTNIDEAFAVCELLYDENGRPCDRVLLEANPRYHEMTGHRAGIGSKARETFPVIENYWFERYHEVVSTGKPFRIEDYSADLGRWFDVYLSRVGGDGSRIFAAVFSEVTERKRREACLAFLSEISSDLVSLTSISETLNVLGARIGKFLDIDSCSFAEINEDADQAAIEYEWRKPGVHSIVGTYRISDFLGDEVRALLRVGRDVTTDDVHADSRVNARQFAALGVASFMCLPILAQGRWRFVLFVHNSRPRIWREDQVEVMREVTARIWARLERAHADEQVRRGAELLNFLIDRSPTGFYIVDADFRISHLNADTQARAFRNINPAIGRRFDDIMHIIWPEPLALEIIGIFRHTLATGEPYQSPGLVSERADLPVVETYDWQLLRITMPDGRHAVVCYYYDTTRLREVERQLLEADRRKDEFLATLAHELRNPLAPIRNGLHMLRRIRASNGDPSHVHEMIERQVNHMVRMVDDLMEVSRITRGKVDLRLERVDLASVINGAIETSKPMIEAGAHHMTVQLPDEPLTLQADAVRLTQLFANLLNNAAKYTDKGGQISLSAQRQGSAVLVSIRDSGIGIPAEMLSKVFDLFTQVDRNNVRSQGGLGIGLTLVRSIVDMHGGSVEVRSAGPGLGSEFLVWLPLGTSGQESTC